MDLLTNYTDKSELQVITAPRLISTIYKSPQHPLIPFQPAVPSPAVPWQRLLTMEILQLHALMSYLHSLPYRTIYDKWLLRLATTSHQTPSLPFTGFMWLGRPSCLQDNSSAPTTQKTQPLYCCRCVPRRCITTGVDSLFVSRSWTINGSMRHRMYINV
jgi:hypothetical protein